MKFEKINSSGYGEVLIGGRRINVKNVLPGEYVTISSNIQSDQNCIIADNIILPSSHRIKPICKHFLACGGCQLQHTDQNFYREYKISLVDEALRRAKYISHPDINFYEISTKSRRRSVFHIGHSSGLVSVGFLQEFSHHIVNIEECFTVTENIFKFVANFRKDMKTFIAQYRIHKLVITEIDNKLDVIFEHNKIFSLAGLELLNIFLKNNNVSRAASCIDKINTILYEYSVIKLIGYDYSIRLPLQYFIQATRECEELLKAKILSLTFGTLNIIDLYSGFGTYSMSLAQQSNITCYEHSKIMVDAMNEAINSWPRKFKARAFVRNLEKNPVSAGELNGYDCVVINPPRSGALNQIKVLSESSIKKIIMISCNPNTFARDISFLQKANFIIDEINIVDQFLYSPHVEIISSFIKT